MTWVNYLLYLIGIVVLIMGIMAFANKPIEYTPKEPAWHAAVKVIFGIIILYLGYIVV
ncbi:hypothetical protein [Methanobacterium congolense]|uniref:Region of a membrane-bound protein predicted to be embedded in the membrane n=1 Tax=Methanobacterium congolense TaxID=118062 RepID=A0A1D3L037_9EURY|nr:hypothetical protein [Methanobacterium congolense]SCG84945.1 Region of a membrane-bound protein predicted to be embedded in the membrane [Methanobacterium congolense]